MHTLTCLDSWVLKQLKLNLAFQCLNDLLCAIVFLSAVVNKTSFMWEQCTGILDLRQLNKANTHIIPQLPLLALSHYKLCIHLKTFLSHESYPSSFSSLDFSDHHRTWLMESSEGYIASFTPLILMSLTHFFQFCGQTFTVSLNFMMLFTATSNLLFYGLYHRSFHQTHFIFFRISIFLSFFAEDFLSFSSLTPSSVIALLPFTQLAMNGAQAPKEPSAFPALKKQSHYILD